MNQPRLKEFTAWVVLLLAVGAIVLHRVRLAPGTDAALHRSIGIALARQALAVGGAAPDVVLFNRDTSEFPQPALDILERAFRKELRHGGGTVSAVREIQADPLRPVEVPPGDFYEEIRRAAAGRVIVSLLGPPLLAPEQWTALGTIKPKIVAFCSGAGPLQVDLRQLVDSGRLHAAVVARTVFEAPLRNTPAHGPATFEQLYTTLAQGNDVPTGQPTTSRPGS